MWPQKNSYGYGRVCWQNFSNWQCRDTRRAEPHKRERCWNRSNIKHWIESEILCAKLSVKATKTGRMHH